MGFNEPGLNVTTPHDVGRLITDRLRMASNVWVGVLRSRDDSCGR